MRSQIKTDEIDAARGTWVAAADDWCKRCHGAIVIGLNYPEHAYLVYWDLIFRKLVPWLHGATEEQHDEQHEKEVVPRIKAFIEASEERQAFLERKIQQQLEYFEGEKEHYGYQKPRPIIKRIC
jgi:hypothetical protein